MSEISDSQFFRTTTGIQSGADTFDRSRLVMTFQPSWELQKYFALSNAKDNTSGSLNRRGIANLPLLRTLLAICPKSLKPSFWEVMESFVLVVYASLAASRTLL